MESSGNIDAEMQELAAVVSSEAFRNEQKSFFEANCDKFDMEEENKLEYTTIHKQYEQMIEDQIKAKLGDEKMAKVEAGLAEFVSNNSADKTTKEVYDAIELLTSLGDFDQFKQLMLEQKSLKNQTGDTGLQMIDKGVMTPDSIPEFMEKLTTLRNEAKASDGWVQLVDKPKLAAWTMQSEQGDTLMRSTIKVDLAPRLMFECMYSTEQESL